jgi:hypothetical protein
VEKGKDYWELKTEYSPSMLCCDLNFLSYMDTEKREEGKKRNSKESGQMKQLKCRNFRYTTNYFLV